MFDTILADNTNTFETVGESFYTVMKPFSQAIKLFCHTIEALVTTKSPSFEFFDSGIVQAIM